MPDFNAQNKFDARLENFSCIKVRENYVQTMKHCINKK